MSFSRLAGGAIFALLISMAPAQAGMASGVWAMQPAAAELGTSKAIPVLMYHKRRAYTVYCYPRDYWWFYRPYTTAKEGYARCMPYFHYPPSAYGAKRGRYNPDVK